jgi:sulfur relay protein TusB/DsrH
LANTLFITSRKIEQLGTLLETALELVSKGESVAFLFFGEGVYSVMNGSIDFKTLEGRFSSVRLFASLEDVRSRGLSARVGSKVNLLDYDGIVDVIMNGSSKVVSYV